MARLLAFSLGAALLLAGCALVPPPAPYGAYYGAYGPAYPDYYGYYGPPGFYGFGCCAGEFRRHEHEHDHDRDHDHDRAHVDAEQHHVAPPASGSSMPGPVHPARGGETAAEHHASSHASAGHEHEDHH